jgi:hypothetical protein
VLLSRDYQTLREALIGALQWEEKAQILVIRREPVDRKAYHQAWERYRKLLERATENVTSSYGQRFSDIFWLCHSLDVARFLKETPKRVLHQDLAVGREHGDHIKYQVFFKYLDRVLAVTYDLVNRLAEETEEEEDELFPKLLGRMRDNVLIFTEDHVSRDLGELSSYFNGSLRIDGKDLRARLSQLSRWHENQIRRDLELRAAVQHAMAADPSGDPDSLLYRSGYVTFLTSRPGYAKDELLGPTHVQVWESLLVKLKEFELLHGLRRLVVPLHRDGKQQLVFAARSLNRTWVGPSVVQVSAATRPLDFLAPWVVDPIVSRFGMVYDITDFSEIVSWLRRSATEDQDRSFRWMFRFQRRVNRLAVSERLKLEKYLGDGAFFSGREASRMLRVALRIQRFYSRALEEGFPFDRGMRIALNHGQYRLLPIQSGTPGDPDRFEFFGHGVVELTRLTTGKSSREIEDIKNFLIAQGYQESDVFRFFAPLSEKNMDLVDPVEESRQFFAYINNNGQLINEGIVATEAFVSHLSRELGSSPLSLVKEGPQALVGIHLETAERPFFVAIRKLGVTRLKGLEPLGVYEIRDGGDAADADLPKIDAKDLHSAVERLFARSVTGE